jgi:hypothetical protein
MLLYFFDVGKDMFFFDLPSFAVAFLGHRLREGRESAAFSAGMTFAPGMLAGHAGN